MFKPKRLMVIAVAVLLLAFIVFKAISFTGNAPVRASIIAELPGCPVSPNCVCSQNSDDDHTITPIQVVGSAADSWKIIKGSIEDEGGKLVSEQDDRYARFEFRSLIFRYVDDLEILLNEAAGTIEIRSASRSGHSDLGMNRKRVESIRLKFSARLKSQE